MTHKKGLCEAQLFFFAVDGFVLL